MIERQVIVTWHTPDEKMPEECTSVVASISMKAGNITYDHALVIANWANDDSGYGGWLFEDPLVNHYMDRVTVHAWCDLEPYGGK